MSGAEEPWRRSLPLCGLPKAGRLGSRSGAGGEGCRMLAVKVENGASAISMMPIQARLSAKSCV